MINYDSIPKEAIGRVPIPKHIQSTLSLIGFTEINQTIFVYSHKTYIGHKARQPKIYLTWTQDTVSAVFTNIGQDKIHKYSLEQFTEPEVLRFLFADIDYVNSR